MCDDRTEKMLRELDIKDLIKINDTYDGNLKLIEIVWIANSRKNADIPQR